MVVEAYVLIKTRPGKARKVAEELSKIPGCKSARNVTGRFDVVLLVEAEDLKALGSLVVDKIHGVDGVESTETAIIV